MSLFREQATFAINISKLILWCAERGILCSKGEAWRPAEMQRIYVQTGRSKTMNSLHGDKLAQDLNFMEAATGKLLVSCDELVDVGAYWESLHPHNSWGGNGVSFKDVPHFSQGRTRPEWRRMT